MLIDEAHLSVFFARTDEFDLTRFDPEIAGPVGLLRREVGHGVTQSRPNIGTTQACAASGAWAARLPALICLRLSCDGLAPHTHQALCA